MNYELEEFHCGSGVDEERKRYTSQCGSLVMGRKCLGERDRSAGTIPYSAGRECCFWRGGIRFVPVSKVCWGQANTCVSWGEREPSDGARDRLVGVGNLKCGTDLGM